MDLDGIPVLGSLFESSPYLTYFLETVPAAVPSHFMADRADNFEVSLLQGSVNKLHVFSSIVEKSRSRGPRFQGQRER